MSSKQRLSASVDSGLPDYGPNPDYYRAVAAGESPWTVDELLRRVNARTLLFAPGTSQKTSATVSG